MRRIASGGVIAGNDVAQWGENSGSANWNYVTTTTTAAPATYYAASSALTPSQ